MTNRAVAIGDIVAGERDRGDLGDIAALAASIEAVGLLHPVVVTKSMALVAGERRLAALRQLGRAEVPVTVVDLATVGEVLRAEADENTQRKALTPYEASRARERRARVLAEDAAKRKAHGKTAPGRRIDEGEQSASAKLDEASATSRATRKVSAIGTGYSGSTLDKVDKVRDVAERGVVRRGEREEPAPPEVREVAKRSLGQIKETGAAVDRASRDVQTAIEQTIGADPDVQTAQRRKRLWSAVSAVHVLPKFDVEMTARDCAEEPELWDAIQAARQSLTEWCTQVDKARPRGLRVVKGGAAQ